MEAYLRKTSFSRTTLRNLMILLGSTTTVLAAVILAPALPAMALAFQETPDAALLVRLTLTMPALFIAIGAPFAGILLDRWGRKPVLIAALTLYGLAGTSGFVLNDLVSILVGRAFLGVAVAGIMSGFTTLIVDYFDGPRLNQFMGYQAAFMGFGGTVFLLLAGALADVGWRYHFLVYLFAFLILPGVLYAVDEPQIQAGPRQQEGGKAKTAVPLKAITVIYVTAFVGMLLFYIFPVQLPFHLSGRIGASNSQIGLALSLQAFASVLIASGYQQIRARLSFPVIFGLVFLALGMNHLVVAFAPDYAVAVAGLLVGGLGLGLLPPSVNVWLASVTPPALRGRAVGGLTTALFLGQFSTPIVTQPVVDQVGLNVTFGAAGGVALLLALVFGGTAVIRSRLKPG